MTATSCSRLRAAGLLPAALLLAPLGALRAADAPKPNILFIITDQQFAEVMSCRMGKQHINTPAMDGLAAQGTLFTRAYSANPLCVPSRNAMFTGRYPHETGIQSNEDIKVKLNPQKFPALGSLFRQAGYDVAYSGKWHLCFPQQAMEIHGFETVTGPQDKSKGTYDVGVAHGAVKFLARPHEKPFLLVASFLNPHNICEWSRRLAGRNDKLNCGEVGPPPPLEQLPPLPANFAPQKNEPDGLALMRRAYQVEKGPFPVGKFTAEDWRALRWGYYRMTELVDKEIGRVMTALRQAGLEENTLVIFTSDHGECAGAFGWNQKTVFFEESARVPLIISWKGKTRAGTSDKLVNTGIDLLPTMMDAAGIPVPKELPGRSLLPVAPGREVPAWREYLVVENDMSQAGTVDGFRPEMRGRMVRTERYKYCVFDKGNQRESLVDLQADPGETVNLAADPEHREVLLQHRELLAQFGRQHNDPLAAKLLADDVKPIPFATPEEKAVKIVK